MKLQGKNGYDISYIESIPKDADTVIVAMHGFCGDKESSCIEALEKKALDFGIGLIKFDWPGHGESEATGEQLTINNCLLDIDSVVEHIKSLLPKARLVAFATSFGGYLTLLYLHKRREVFSQIILRSPAINMYSVLVSSLLTADDLSQMKKTGLVKFGFERELDITSDFLNELKDNEINELFDGVLLPEVSIIHGTDDDLVPFADSEVFASEHDCRLFPVKGADHRYKKDGEIDKVVEMSLQIIKNGK